MEGRIHCPCSKCKSYLATKNCFSCSTPLCVGCVKVAVVKFGSYRQRQDGDFEFLERCGDCYVNDKLPVVIDARTSQECLIQ